MSAEAYFESVRKRLLTDSLIVWHEILTERVSPQEGYLRARVYFTDNSLMDFSEFIVPAESGELEHLSYRFHWQDAQTRLIRRWDNTPHFPAFPGFPHHVHDGQTGEVSGGEPVNFFVVLDEISAILNQ